MDQYEKLIEMSWKNIDLAWEDIYAKSIFQLKYNKVKVNWKVSLVE